MGCFGFRLGSDGFVDWPFLLILLGIIGFVVLLEFFRGCAGVVGRVAGLGRVFIIPV